MGKIFAIALAAYIVVSFEVKAENSSMPFKDYLTYSSYGTIASIEPTGYFELGRRYVHPPRVEWKTVPNASTYELLLIQKDKLLGTTTAVSSPCFIKQGWSKIKPGKAGIVVRALDSSGKIIASSRLFPFYAVPDFNTAQTAKPKRNYKQAALMAFNALNDYRLPPGFQEPSNNIHRILLGCTVMPQWLCSYSFPVLHNWIHVEMLVQLNAMANASLKEKIAAYARSTGDHLLLARIPEEGNVYGGMIRGCVDWNGNPALGLDISDPAIKEKMLRLVEPSKNGYAAGALVRVYKLTNDQKYLDAAAKIGEVLLRTQLEDGSWPARVDAKTGEVIAMYSTSVSSVVSFFDRLNDVRPDKRYIASRDRAVKWLLEYPIKSYGWVVNYDDMWATATKENPFTGSLSNWDAFEFVRWISEYPDAIPNAKAVAKEILDWNDNNFVFYGSDPLLPIEPFYPSCAEQGTPSSFTSSYSCWVPMDFHTANWGLALVAAYKLTGEKAYLEKARAAGNTLTQYQLDEGMTMTWMCDRYSGVSAVHPGSSGSHSFWPGGWAMSSALWSVLTALEAETTP